MGSYGVLWGSSGALWGTFGCYGALWGNCRILVKLFWSLWGFSMVSGSSPPYGVFYGSLWGLVYDAWMTPLYGLSMSLYGFMGPPYRVLPVLWGPPNGVPSMVLSMVSMGSS